VSFPTKSCVRPYYPSSINLSKKHLYQMKKYISNWNLIWFPNKKVWDEKCTHAVLLAWICRTFVPFYSKRKKKMELDCIEFRCIYLLHSYIGKYHKIWLIFNLIWTLYMIKRSIELIKKEHFPFYLKNYSIFSIGYPSGPIKNSSIPLINFHFNKSKFHFHHEVQGLITSILHFSAIYQTMGCLYKKLNKTMHGKIWKINFVFFGKYHIKITVNTCLF
jgi:hypothetical protein